MILNITHPIHPFPRNILCVLNFCFPLIFIFTNKIFFEYKSCYFPANYSSSINTPWEKKCPYTSIFRQFWLFKKSKIAALNTENCLYIFVKIFPFPALFSKHLGSSKVNVAKRGGHPFILPPSMLCLIRPAVSEFQNCLSSSTTLTFYICTKHGKFFYGFWFVTRPKFYLFQRN